MGKPLRRPLAVDLSSLRSGSCLIVAAEDSLPCGVQRQQKLIGFLGRLTLNCRTKSCSSARVMLSSGRCGTGVSSLGTI